MSENPGRKCYGCGGELRDGVRFCVRCGTDNFDPDAGRLATAKFEMGAHERKSAFARIVSGLRYLMFGIRR